MVRRRMIAALVAAAGAFAYGAPAVAVAAKQAPPVTLARRLPTAGYSIAVAPGEVLHVESTGAGTPVVVLPGLLGSAFGFRNVVGPLALSGHRVIVVEPLGVGWSARPKNADYSLEAQARRVAAVMDSMHVARATILAHSVGASTALRLALARPDLVAGVVSIEGGIAESAGTPGLKNALSLASVLGHFGMQGMVMGRMRARFRDSSGDPSWITDPVMAGYLAPLKDRYQDVIAGYRAMAAAPEPVALAPRLARLKIPVVLLLGSADHDGGPGDDEVAAMRARLQGLRVVPVPGAGHWIQEERPQAVVDAVNRVAR